MINNARHDYRKVSNCWTAKSFSILLSSSIRLRASRFELRDGTRAMRHRLCNKQLTQLTIVVAELAQQDAGSFPKRLPKPLSHFHLYWKFQRARAGTSSISGQFSSQPKDLSRERIPLFRLTSSSSSRKHNYQGLRYFRRCTFVETTTPRDSTPVKLKLTNSSKNRFDHLNACRWKRKKRLEQTWNTISLSFESRR